MVIPGPFPASSEAEPGIQLSSPVIFDSQPSALRSPYIIHRMRGPAVYILTSHPHGTLYIGVTSDLIKRVWEHRSDSVDGFTRRYQVHRLVYFEQHHSMMEAIEREKELKKWRRTWKIKLIEGFNPDWRDLWPGTSR